MRCLPWLFIKVKNDEEINNSNINNSNTRLDCLLYKLTLIVANTEKGEITYLWPYNQYFVP